MPPNRSDARGLSYPYVAVGRTGDSVGEDRLVILTAGEDSQDIDPLGCVVHNDGDHHALLVDSRTQAGPQVIPHRSSMREDRQPFAVGHNRLHVVSSDLRRGRLRDIAVEGLKLICRLRSESYGEGHRSVGWVTCARTWSGDIDVEGSVASRS